MMLYPLAEVRIGVLMPIRVSRGKFVMDILRDSKWGEPEEDTDERQCQPRAEHDQEAPRLCS